MKKYPLIRIISFILVLAMLSGCGTGTKSSNRPSLMIDTSGRQNTFSFSAETSESLKLSASGAASVLKTVSEQQADYVYTDLYKLDEVKKRLNFNAKVESHKYSVLNSAGALDAAHMAQLVEANNEAFLAQSSFGYENIESDYLLKLCEFLVTVVDAMKQKYPNIDWQRVYCNLGNLKILYKPGMLSYAQVSNDLVLSISKNNTGIVLNLKGEDAFSRVLTHETIHILQIGCVCEQIENCDRRAGISVFWDDFLLNTTDWTWFVEGSAERNMCNLTGSEAITYQYKMDYICSFTMSVLLKDNIEADTMETICFYDDPNLLFNAFGAKTQAQQDEILKMMITMEVLQSEPSNFFEAYTTAYGTDPRNDEETLNQFYYSLKPSVCITLAKEFFENLVAFMQEKQITVNDLFLLLNLFEGQLNQHLNYSSESKAEINATFITAYTAMRNALFAAVEAENSVTDFSSLYSNYDIIAAGDGLLNGELNMLSKEKLEFIAERAQWLSELNGLGQKVPLAR